MAMFLFVSTDYYYTYEQSTRKVKIIWRKAIHRVDYREPLGGTRMKLTRFLVASLEEARTVVATVPKSAALFFIDQMKLENKEIGAYIMVSSKPFELESIFTTQELIDAEPKTNLMRLCV
jgi:hypothetical protein